MNCRHRRVWFVVTAFAAAQVCIVKPAAAGPDRATKALSKALPEVVKKFRAAGMPWIAADLPGYPIKPVDDGWPLLHKAYGMTDWQKFDWVKLSNTTHLDDSTFKADLLKPYEPALDLVVTASMKRAIDLDFDRSAHLTDLLSSDSEFSRISEVRFLMWPLAVRAAVRARDGDAEGAASDLIAMRRISSLLGQSPGLIPILLGYQIDTVAMQTAQECAGYLNSSGSGLSILDGALSESVPPLSFRRAILGEAYRSVVTARESESIQVALRKSFGAGKSGSVIGFKASAGLPRSIEARASLAYDLRMWTELAGALSNVDPRVPARRMVTIASEDAGGSPYARMAASMFPDFRKQADLIVSDQTDLRVTTLLVRALEYKARTGGSPHSLDLLERRKT